MKKSIESTTDLKDKEILIDWEFIDVATLVENGYSCKVRKEGLVFSSILEAQIAVELCLNYNQAVANQQKEKH